jgi:hypothetical protein
MPPTVLTTSEAVRTYHAHPVTILRLILTGRVSAEKDANGRWLIVRADLERWNRTRRRPARVALLKNAEALKYKKVVGGRN